MLFCKTCGLFMQLNPSSGLVVYDCNGCHRREAGGAYAARVGGGGGVGDETITWDSPLIMHAPFDRVNQIVAQDCPQCGLDYMVQLCIGPQAKNFTICKCGYALGRDAAGAL
jgi:hypothetical protein